MNLGFNLLPEWLVLLDEAKHVEVFIDLLCELHVRALFEWSDEKLVSAIPILSFHVV
jgi:hypothetical protein